MCCTTDLVLYFPCQYLRSSPSLNYFSIYLPCCLILAHCWTTHAPRFWNILATSPSGSATTSGIPVSPEAESCKNYQTVISAILFRAFLDPYWIIVIWVIWIPRLLRRIIVSWSINWRSDYFNPNQSLGYLYHLQIILSNDYNPIGIQTPLSQR